ncbi:hypothetical protein F66182_3313 [Fusarium sp. NRRL 66182]|nr:hypothetical protein F66182_3313 [Fusarium sp. NRRL 66182]
MAGKNSNERPLWRPLTRKLSTLILRRRSSKDKTRVDAPPPDEAAEAKDSRFRLLEVQSNALQGLRLPNGWLVEPTNPDKQGQQSPPPLRPTPVIHQHALPPPPPPPPAPKIDPPETLKLPELHQLDLDQDTQPLTITDEPNVAEKEQARASTLATLTRRETSTTRSVLDRGRPVEARHLIHQPNRNSKHHRKSLLLELDALAQASSQDCTSASSPAATVGSVAKTEVVAPPSTTKERPVSTPIRPRKSTIRQVTRSPSPAPVEAADSALKAKPVQIPPGDDQPVSQRPANQRPLSIAATGTAAANAATVAKSAPITRVKSKQQGTWSDRLAWIQKLEERGDAKPSQDWAALQKRSGSVSDRLAMFEKKNLSAAAPAKRLVSSTRTTSATYSITGRDSIFSADSNASAPSARTSIDTARTNTRVSSVMSYYDDSFREKLETLVGQEPEAVVGQEPETDTLES